MRVATAVDAVVVAVLLVLVPVSRARAADLFAPVALEWDAPPGCPDGAAVERETSRLLRGSARNGAPPLQAHAKVDHASERVWRMQLKVGAEGAARTVEAATCRELADAAAFILAAAVDPATIDEEPPEPPAPTPTPTPMTSPASTTSRPSSPAVPVDPHEVPPPEPPPEPRVAKETGSASLALTAAVWIDGGLLPGGAVAPALGFEWRPHPSVIVEPMIAYFPHSHAGTDGDADFRMGAADVRVAYVLASGRVEAIVVTGAELDWLYGKGDGGAAAGSGGTAFVSWLLGPRLRVQLDPTWAVRVEADGVVPLERPLFILDAATIVHEPAVISGRVSFGVERRF